VSILHLASFTGNIGDNASHYGTYNLLGVNNVDRLEMRRFYHNHPNRMYFKETFVDNVNQYDLLLIGGGGFLDYFIDDSVTGTTLDITDDILEKITTPILIMSMGALPRYGKQEKNLIKLRKFINRLKDKAHIFLRNDGSVKQFPEIPQVLDSGFFYEDIPGNSEDYIAVNVSTDLIGDSELLVTEIAKIVERLNERFVFVPHTFGDINSINRVLTKVNPYTVASRVNIAPYKQGFKGARELFAVYRESKQVIATRYHANVCSIAMGKPVVGIQVADKIGDMYKSIGLSAVEIKPDLSVEVISKLGQTYNIDDLKTETCKKYSKVLTTISNR